MSPTVHVLLCGQALCGSVHGVPKDWGPGHQWVRVEERAEATCAVCKQTAEAVALTANGVDEARVALLRVLEERAWCMRLARAARSAGSSPMSNAKRRHRRRRRNRLATEWWHLMIGGRLVLFPPSHRLLQRDPVFLKWAASVVPE